MPPYNYAVITLSMDYMTSSVDNRYRVFQFSSNQPPYSIQIQKYDFHVDRYKKAYTTLKSKAISEFNNRSAWNPTETWSPKDSLALYEEIEDSLLKGTFYTVFYFGHPIINIYSVETPHFRRS